MPKRNATSHLLRQQAEALMRTLVEDGEVPESQQADLATSLVRQWITYAGHATLFLGEEQVYFVLGRTPLGKPRVVAEADLGSWPNQLRRDWQIDPEDLPQVLEQLNRGQSAEVTNEAGIPLRLWVNPREKGRGVEPLVMQPPLRATPRNYLKIAIDVLEHQLGPDLEEDERAALAGSVAGQWQKHEGHASLFVDGERLALRLTERADGGSCVDTERRPARIEPLLASLGFAAEVLAEVIARINLGQEVEFRDPNGVRSRLSHDPKTGRLRVRRYGPAAAAAPCDAPMLFCPNCTAVLPRGQEGTSPQRCPHCGHAVGRR